MLAWLQLCSTQKLCGTIMHLLGVMIMFATLLRHAWYCHLCAGILVMQADYNTML